jgi:hypothetical protein
LPKDQGMCSICNADYEGAGVNRHARKLIEKSLSEDPNQTMIIHCDYHEDVAAEYLCLIE